MTRAIGQPRLDLLSEIPELVKDRETFGIAQVFFEIADLMQIGAEVTEYSSCILVSYFSLYTCFDGTFMCDGERLLHPYDRFGEIVDICMIIRVDGHQMCCLDLVTLHDPRAIGVH